jgi:triosephosphate isomerase (TIM)
MTIEARRKPFALANWKMTMTMTEGLEFAGRFRQAVGDLPYQMEIVLCPPYTAIYSVSGALAGSAIHIGGQNLFTGPGVSHTAEISAPLLSDAGCTWVMLGHWEVRRRLAETDPVVNEKMLAAFEAGLRPILMIGEAAGEKGHAAEVLSTRFDTALSGLSPLQVSEMAICYEPEWTINAREPAPTEDIASACSSMRGWIRKAYGTKAAEGIRIIYGGSVTPEYAGDLLSSEDVDGLGAGRKGRDPAAFSQIVKKIAAAKGLYQE